MSSGSQDGRSYWTDLSDIDFRHYQIISPTTDSLASQSPNADQTVSSTHSSQLATSSNASAATPQSGSSGSRDNRKYWTDLKDLDTPHRQSISETSKISSLSSYSSFSNQSSMSGNSPASPCSSPRAQSGSSGSRDEKMDLGDLDAPHHQSTLKTSIDSSSSSYSSSSNKSSRFCNAPESSFRKQARPPSICRKTGLSRERMELRKLIGIYVSPEEERQSEELNPYRGIDMNKGWNRESYVCHYSYEDRFRKEQAEIRRGFFTWSWKSQDNLLPASRLSGRQTVDAANEAPIEHDGAWSTSFSYIFNTTGRVNRSSLHSRHKFRKAFSPTATGVCKSSSHAQHSFTFRSALSLPPLPPPSPFPSHTPATNYYSPPYSSNLPTHEDTLSTPPAIDETLPPAKRQRLLRHSSRSTASRSKRRKAEIRASRWAKSRIHILNEHRAMARVWLEFCWVLDGEVDGRDWDVRFQRRAFEGDMVWDGDGDDDDDE